MDRSLIKVIHNSLLKGAVILILLLGAATGLQAQIDTEFWFAVPELSHRGNTGGSPARLRIATLELEADVTISMPANTYDPVLNPTGFRDTTLSIAANSAGELDLSHLIDDAANPDRNLLENKPLTLNGVNDFGLHISSTNLINVYWEINYLYGSDLWTLKGTNGLGTEFYTPFQTFYDNRNLSPRAYSAIDVVASKDNTQVTFHLPAGVAASFGSSVTTLLAGSTHTVNLDAGQTFSLYPRNFSTAAGDRLAGTYVESTEPIAVSVKDDALDTGSKGQAVIGDQLVPVDIVGDNYIVPDVKSPNHIYVVATEDNTPIYLFRADGTPLGLSPYVTLDQGEQALVILPTGSKFGRLTSNVNAGDPYKPFYVFQLTVANQTRGGALVPAIGCTGNTQLAFTRAREGENIFYFYIITQAGHEDKFLVDGVRNDGVIDPGAFTPIDGTGNWVAQLTTSLNINVLPVGQHLVENTGGIFHLAIMNGFPGAGQGGFYYGYYSDFGGLNIGASVAGTNSDEIRACYGDSVQLFAYGGTNYSWYPTDYLDDPFSNMPTAINLPAGAHLYEVEVSGACGSGILPITVQVAAPITAHFETNVSSGCSPLTIEFEDLSQGTYSWQFDLGDSTGLLRYDLDDDTPYPEPPDPFVFENIYTNSTDSVIQYEITLLAKNASGCAQVLRKTISVFPEVQAGMSVDLDDDCDPLQVQFSNHSTGDTATWHWEFGDGGSSPLRDPMHLYRNQFGPDNLFFDAQLVAISPYNCRDTAHHSITVRPYIEAIFTYDTVTECSPHEILITDQSIGADTYQWDLGDGFTTDLPGPILNHTYVNNGTEPDTFTIHLRVENEEGCWHEVSREVAVFPAVVADFSVQPPDLCSPGDVSFTNLSTGADTYHWDFGDGGSSALESPVHRYDRNLLRHDTVFTVTLTVTSDEFCTDTLRRDIRVHPYIEAAFTVDDVVGCHPFEVDIHNESVGVDIYEWTFGDGNNSATLDTLFSYTYDNLGSSSETYPLTLIVSNTEGCSDTLVRPITVHPEITASFSSTATSGCHPLDVSFTDLSDNAVNYYWDFGDGAASVEPSPDHLFTNFGSSDTTYFVTLTTSTADGECVDDRVWPITVFPQVQAEFTFPSYNGCGPFEVTFTNLSIGGSMFTWDFDDGLTVNTTGMENQTHIFINNDFSASRQYDVSLTAQNLYGCSHQVTKPLEVFPGIDALFEATDTLGCHPLAVDFTNQSNGGASWVWDFGDGATSSLEAASHVFTNTGAVDSVYQVKLLAIASNNICTDSFFMDIRVHPFIEANFTLPVSAGCQPLELEIRNSSVQGTSFYWTFDDGSDTTTYDLNSFTHTFVNPDFDQVRDYLITLHAENDAGCSSEISRTVSVEPDIDALFTSSTPQGCHPLTVEFTNQSQGDSYYLWDFDNGTTSELISPVQTFTNIGSVDSTYRVWLRTVAGNHECRDSFYVDIVVHPFIQADFTFLEQVACSPSPVLFHNASVGGSTFNWDFGDGSDTIITDTSSVNHIFYNSDPLNNGVYQVSLEAVNAAGCRSSVSRTVEVYPAINADFIPDVVEGCHPLQVDFSNISSGGYLYSWEFGDSASSEAADPVYTFRNFADTIVSREVSLLATSRFHCTSEIAATITIHPLPVARFETDRVIGCAPFEVPVENTSINAEQYIWTFGSDTTILTGSMGTVTHSFDNTGENISTHVIRLEAETAYGCGDTLEQEVYVYPRAEAAFSVNDGDCSPFMAYFQNESVRGHTYDWEFGDGTMSSSTDPSNLYFNHGGQDTTFEVSLLTTTRYGCLDSTSQTIMVYAQPDVEFTADPTHQMYPDAEVSVTNLSNVGYWSYDWQFGDATGSIREDPAPHTYATWGDYEISLLASTPYCVDSVSHRITILPPDPIPEFDPVPGACEPYTVSFNNRSTYGASYEWDFDDGSTSSDRDPVHEFENHGYYNVKLTVTGPGGQQDITYQQVEVFRLPEADFRVQPDLVMLPDDEAVFFNLSKFGATYLWDFGDGNTAGDENPRHLYTEVGTYPISLDVWTEHGCHDQIIKDGAVTVEGEGLIKFPNAFKPDMHGPSGGGYDLNAEENNEIFHPYWKGVAEYTLVIYTRWGEKLFTSTDVNIGWDGYFKSKLCDQDVYVYKSWGYFVNGEMFNLDGDVTLIHHDKGN